jgi:hypothetical protein
LWRNRQTKAHLVLRPKPRNHRGDFEAPITKPELLVLRPKARNPPPPWFWGSTKKPTADFEAKPGETVATSFEAKLEKTVATGFEAKLVKTIRVVLRPKHSQTIDLGLRLNQETRAPSLRVTGADRTWRHQTSRPPGYRVPDLCDHPLSSAPGLLLLPQSSSLHSMPHLPPAHHETSKRDSPNETKGKEKQNKTTPDLNWNIAKSMNHHNQTKELTTWFLRLHWD